jgi:hypothetical protein
VVWLKGGSLLARRYLAGPTSLPVPDNQWVEEFKNYFNIQISGLILSSVQYARGPHDPKFVKNIVAPPQEDEWMCHNQILQGNGLESFSVLGLIIIFSIGSLIIIANITLEPMIDWAHHTPRSDTTTWKITSMLHLQRMAFKSEHKGTWNYSTAKVPVTEKNERFSPLIGY